MLPNPKRVDYVTVFPYSGTSTKHYKCIQPGFIQALNGTVYSVKVCHVTCFFHTTTMQKLFFYYYSLVLKTHLNRPFNSSKGQRILNSYVNVVG